MGCTGRNGVHLNGANVGENGMGDEGGEPTVNAIAVEKNGVICKDGHLALFQKKRAKNNGRAWKAFWELFPKKFRSWNKRKRLGISGSVEWGKIFLDNSVFQFFQLYK